MKPHKSQSLHESFKYAWEGIRHTFIHERNFKIHVICAILTIIICIVLPVDTLHRFMVIYAIFFVLCMELINTAAESLVDLHCGKNLSPLAKVVKDCCAGAVLLASIQAIIVAIIVAIHILSRL
ncbi:MAG: diacylglycerol kinase family protein [Defluviitaleaceae bacterium]|nr:diacylglycerol kinase family protein [Defluviitaleaceae bacterium]